MKKGKRILAMRKITKKLSALLLTTMFATMQIAYAEPIDTGLGAGLGGAVINNATSGLVGVDTSVPDTATLNFNASTQVNWDTLNLNSNETMNFNAVDGATGLTILNTVSQGMSTIYGQINANGGIGKLIISNPNGVLFDGAKFTTAGDAMITTQGAALGANGIVNFDTTVPTGYALDGSAYVMTIQNSDFSVGGELNFVAPTMNVVRSAFNTKDGAGNVRFTTTNGQDYYVTGGSGSGTTVSVDQNDPNYDAVVTIGTGSGTQQRHESQSMRLEAIQVNGDVYITSDKGIVKMVNGGEINGNLNVNADGSVAMNYVNNDNILHVTGDVNAKANNTMMYLKKAQVDGNVNMTNGGGYLEVEDITVNKDMNLKTTDERENIEGYKHFVHVNGNTTVKGNANIDSYNNIHIGNYVIDGKIYRDEEHTKFYYDGHLLPGEFNVGGDLTAKTTSGHITNTVNVNVGGNASLEANSTNDGTRTYGGNILADPNSVLTAKTYEFKADGYIGALQGFDQYTTDQTILNTMEDYTHIAGSEIPKSHGYYTIGGGTITKLETPNTTDGKPVQVYIKSNGDVTLTGANTNDINITAPQKQITITGDVHANNINVGPETNYLKLDFDGRDFTTNYTNIRDEKVVTIRPDEVITYDLADGGYNQPTLTPDDQRTTYLFGPGKPDTPDTPNIDPNDNAKLLRNWAPDDPTAAPVNTPVAFAADLDDDEEAAGVRKNVDGSVTVVRAFPMGM